MVTATINPEKAQGALRRLCEEMFPEIATEREDAVDRALDIMNKEREKVYSVAPVGQTLKKTAWARFQNILKKRRRSG